MAVPAKVAIIIGSTRPLRIASQVARFVHDTIAKPSKAHRRTASLSILDLKDFSLPIFDEPIIPNRVTSPEGYSHEHTRVWSRIISSFDAFIFISAQRNWGIPAELKNCIDFLFNEWKGKPAMIVTYGGHGGVQAGEQLGTVLRSVRMRVAERMVSLTFPSAAFREKAFLGEDVGLDAGSESGDWSGYRELITEVFWEDLMKGLDEAEQAGLS